MSNAALILLCHQSAWQSCPIWDRLPALHRPCTTSLHGTIANRGSCSHQFEPNRSKRDSIQDKSHGTENVTVRLAHAAAASRTCARSVKGRTYYTAGSHISEALSDELQILPIFWLVLSLPPLCGADQLEIIAQITTMQLTVSRCSRARCRYE